MSTPESVESPVDHLSKSAQKSPVGQSPLRVVLGSRLYLGATIALFLSGLGISAAAPQIASFLVNELGASLTTAGLYYLTSLTAPIAGYFIGARSDATGKRLGLFFTCAIIGFLGWTGIAFSTQLWMPFVISAVALGLAGAATSQLFAAVHDELNAHPQAGNDGVITVVRMALTAGWVIGPVVGAFLAAGAGLRTMLFATALCTLAQILPLIGVREGASKHASPVSEIGQIPTKKPGLLQLRPLLIFTALYICVYAGESVKYAFLPLYMNGQLHLAPALSGSIIGIQPLVEIALMPVAVVVARKTGLLRLMIIAAACGVGANLCFAFTGTAAGLFAGQILMGAVWGVFAGLGIIVAQRLLPTAVATASAIFMSSTALSSAIGGLAGGLGVAAVGLPLVFIIPAVFAGIAVVGLIWMSSKYGSRL